MCDATENLVWGTLWEAAIDINGLYGFPSNQTPSSCAANNFEERRSRGRSEPCQLSFGDSTSGVSIGQHNRSSCFMSNAFSDNTNATYTESCDDASSLGPSPSELEFLDTIDGKDHDASGYENDFGKPKPSFVPSQLLFSQNFDNTGRYRDDSKDMDYGNTTCNSPDSSMGSDDENCISSVGSRNRSVYKPVLSDVQEESSCLESSTTSLDIIRNTSNNSVAINRCSPSHSRLNTAKDEYQSGYEGSNLNLTDCLELSTSSVNNMIRNAAEPIGSVCDTEEEDSFEDSMRDDCNDSLYHADGSNEYESEMCDSMDQNDSDGYVADTKRRIALARDPCKRNIQENCAYSRSCIDSDLNLSIRSQTFSAQQECTPKSSRNVLTERVPYKRIIQEYSTNASGIGSNSSLTIAHCQSNQEACSTSDLSLTLSMSQTLSYQRDCSPRSSFSVLNLTLSGSVAEDDCEEEDDVDCEDEDLCEDELDYECDEEYDDEYSEYEEEFNFIYDSMENHPNSMEFSDEVDVCRTI